MGFWENQAPNPIPGAGKGRPPGPCSEPHRESTAHATHRVGWEGSDHHGVEPLVQGRDPFVLDQLPQHVSETIGVFPRRCCGQNPTVKSSGASWPDMVTPEDSLALRPSCGVTSGTRPQTAQLSSAWDRQTRMSGALVPRGEERRGQRNGLLLRSREGELIRLLISLTLGSGRQENEPGVLGRK